MGLNSSRIEGPYSPLDERDEIRLLTLVPAASHDDLIVCDLTYARLSEKPKYEALSYEWGSKTDQKTALIRSYNGDYHRSITSNLWEALSHLRYRKQHRVLWVDAICINQADTTERDHQVLQMGTVYGEASSVIVWLGKEDPGGGTREAFHTFNIMSRVTGEISTRTLINSRAWTVESIAEHCRREYWSRLWIIQEVVLAGHITIQCGTWHASWTSFNQALNLLTGQTFLYDSPSHRMVQAVKTMQDSAAFILCQERRRRKDLPGKDRQTILDLVKRYQKHGCEDVRDKVFGLHGLALDCCRKAVPVDSTCSAYRLCGKILAHQFAQHKGCTLSASQKLHQLMIRGSLQQRGTPNSFPIGAPTEMAFENETSFSMSLDSKGTINFITPTTARSTPAIVLPTPLGFRKNFSLPLPQIYSRVAEGIDLVAQVPVPLQVLVYRISQVTAKWSTQIRDQLIAQLTGQVKERTSSPPPIVSPKTPIEEEVLRLISPIAHILRKQSSETQYKLFSGLSGVIGLGPENIEPGDTICVVNSSAPGLLAIVRTYEGQSGPVLVATALALHRGNPVAEQRPSIRSMAQSRQRIAMDITGLRILSQVKIPSIIPS